MISTMPSQSKRINAFYLGLIFIIQIILSSCSMMSVATKSGKVVVQNPKPHCVIINEEEKCVERLNTDIKVL